jgi:hypothetical protein
MLALFLSVCLWLSGYWLGNGSLTFAPTRIRLQCGDAATQASLCTLLTQTGLTEHGQWRYTANNEGDAAACTFVVSDPAWCAFFEAEYGQPPISALAAAADLKEAIAEAASTNVDGVAGGIAHISEQCVAAFHAVDPVRSSSSSVAHRVVSKTDPEAMVVPSAAQFGYKALSSSSVGSPSSVAVVLTESVLEKEAEKLLGFEWALKSAAANLDLGWWLTAKASSASAKSSEASIAATLSTGAHVVVLVDDESQPQWKASPLLADRSTAKAVCPSVSVYTARVVADGRQVTMVESRPPSRGDLGHLTTALHLADLYASVASGQTSATPADEKDVAQLESNSKQLMTWVQQRLTRRQIRMLLDGLVMANGGAEDGCHEITTASASFRDALLQLCLHAGYSADFVAAGEGLRDSWSLSGGEAAAAAPSSWKVRFSDASQQLTHPAIPTEQIRSAQPDCVYDAARDGRVWCVQVDHPDHMIVAQRALRESSGNGLAVTCASRPLIVGNCLDILANQWSPIYDVSAILASIQSLLTDPNPNSPANVEAAKLYVENRREYDRKVAEVIEGLWKLEEAEKRANGDNSDEDDEEDEENEEDDEDEEPEEDADAAPRKKQKISETGVKPSNGPAQQQAAAAAPPAAGGAGAAAASAAAASAAAASAPAAAQ